MILALLGYSSLFEDVPFNSILPDYKSPQIELCRRDSFRSNLAHFLHKRPSHSLHALRGVGWRAEMAGAVVVRPVL